MNEKMISTVKAYHAVSLLFDALSIGSRRAVLVLLNENYGPRMRKKRKYTRRYKRSVRRVKKDAA